MKIILDFIKELYPDCNPVPLHTPVFLGNEKKYLNECITTTFVSYVGTYVTRFEEITAKFTGSKYAVAIVNGTAGLQIALYAAGVGLNDEVITQPLTFVATVNAISHCGAQPVFTDVDYDTMGMSPEMLHNFLSTKCDVKDNYCINRLTGRKIKAVVPVHTFGHPCRIDEIIEVARKFNLIVIEDAAESLGSFYKGKHTGTFGLAGVFSYNGNKTITTGGGGMVITDNEEFAKKLKHITSTAKINHKWEFIHDEIAWNYRLTNLNAAVGVAQMEYLDKILSNKRETADLYGKFFERTGIDFLREPAGANSNYWLNMIFLKDKTERDKFLKITNENGIQTRPVWRLMTDLEMYKGCQVEHIDNSILLQERGVNIPSGYRVNKSAKGFKHLMEAVNE